MLCLLLRARVGTCCVWLTVCVARTLTLARAVTRLWCGLPQYLAQDRISDAVRALRRVLKDAEIQTSLRRARWKLRQLELLNMTQEGKAFMEKYKRVRVR